MRDTPRLENAYRSFGNVMHVENWFKAECFAPPVMRNADAAGKVIEVTKITGKPLWYLPVVQLEYRPAERLSMNTKLDTALIYCNKWTDKISADTITDLKKMARKKNKKDWRVELIGAFESLTYQRQGRNKWVLIEIAKGYA